MLNNPIRYDDPTGHWVFETDDPEKELRTTANAHAIDRDKKHNSRPNHVNPNDLTEAGQMAYDVYVELFNNSAGWWWSDPNLGGDGNFSVADFVAMVLFEESGSTSQAPFFGEWTETNVRGFYQWAKGQDAQFTSGSAGLLNYMWSTSGRNTRTADSFDGGPNAEIEVPAMQGVVNAMLNPASANHPGCPLCL